MPAGMTRWRVVAELLAESAQAVLGWIFLAPLSLLVPRVPGRHAVIGSTGGRFADNSKYFYLAALAARDPGVRATFLTDHRPTAAAIAAAGGAVARLSGLRGYVELLRCEWVVVDTADWRVRGRSGATRGARILQLWHGVPLKEIDLADFSRRVARLPAPARPLLRWQKVLVRRHHPVDLLAGTSATVNAVLGRYIPARRIATTGLPRNDVLAGDGGLDPALVRLNVCAATTQRIAAFRNATPAGRVVLYAPTFRDHDRHRLPLAPTQWQDLAAWARDHDALVLVKLHPFVATTTPAPAHAHLHFVGPRSDVYPLLREVDLLLTDYSSIYFDYLLLDRPIVFYPYDLARYVAEERRLLFDYEAMAPGPKAMDFDALLPAMSAALDPAADSWREPRARVRALVFEHMDGHAGQRVLAELRSGR